jgi:hypothetical protein
LVDKKMSWAPGTGNHKFYRSNVLFSGLFLKAIVDSWRTVDCGLASRFQPFLSLPFLLVMAGYLLRPILQCPNLLSPFVLRKSLSNFIRNLRMFRVKC